MEQMKLIKQGSDFGSDEYQLIDQSMTGSSLTPGQLDFDPSSALAQNDELQIISQPPNRFLFYIGGGILILMALILLLLPKKEIIKYVEVKGEEKE